MPANLPPQYFNAEKRYREAREPDDKIEALQEMMAIMPRHKGTDKLYAGLRHKIAKLTQVAEKKHATARRAGFEISREGAGQVILVGPTNTGKSQLLAAVTEASPEVADYPFTTQTPLPGMMKFENIQIQLVDTPPMGHRSVRVMLTNTLRSADLIAIVVDLAAEPASQVEVTLQGLAGARIASDTSDVAELEQGVYRKKMLIIGNKSDLEGSAANWQRLIKRYGGMVPLASISAGGGVGLGKLRETIYRVLDIMRVYTKTPGQKAELSEPVILKRGSSVKDAAADIHKDFRDRLKYAVVWGSGKYDGQRVSRGHILRDGDVVEFHI